MSNFFLQNTADYSSHFDFDYEVARWTEEASVMATRDDTDIDHPACMKIVSSADGNGVHYTQAASGSMKYVIEFAYKNIVTQEIDYLIYDVTNAVPIASGTLTEISWSIFYKEITTPDTCASMRLYLRAGTASGVAFYIDDIVMQGNAMEREPDDYNSTLPAISNTHQAIARKIIDQTYANFEASMSWKYLPSANLNILRNMRRLGKPTYFDDSDVPQMTEGKHLYTETIYTFLGITNPSASHLAYYDIDSGLPALSTDFEDTEFSTADYSDITSDDSDATSRSNSTIKAYQYEKYIFNVTEYTTLNEVRSISIKWIGTCVDTTPNTTNGVSLYVWNGVAWLGVARSRTGDEQTLRFTTTKLEQAQDFVDTAGGKIIILVRSNGYGSSSGVITLETDYIEAIVNEGMNEIIQLSNKAVLDAGMDIVSVENITQDTTLSLGADYTIGDDRQSIITIGQAAGDYIEVTYNQYYYVMVENIPMHNLSGNNISAPNRQINMSLTSLVRI